MAGLPLFPSLPGLTWPVKRSGPIFDTIRQKAISGKETTLPKRITPLWTWELAFDFLRSASKLELQTLAGFYASRFGATYPFGYVDPDDSVVTDQLLGTGNGVNKAFQLVRAFGGFVEPVFLPTILPTIKVGNVVPVLGTDYALAVGGLVTFTNPPAAGVQVTWSGTYAWTCRFDDDKIDFTNFMSGLWSVEKLSFSSILV